MLKSARKRIYDLNLMNIRDNKENGTDGLNRREGLTKKKIKLTGKEK